MITIQKKMKATIEVNLILIVRKEMKYDQEEDAFQIMA